VGLLKNLILVPVIMACATGGTIGLMKLIKRFSPNAFGENPEYNERRR